MATLSIEDIKHESPFTLQIYPNLENQGFHLAVDGDGQRMVLDARRVQRIFITSIELSKRFIFLP